ARAGGAAAQLALDEPFGEPLAALAGRGDVVPLADVFAELPGHDALLAAATPVPDVPHEIRRGSAHRARDRAAGEDPERRRSPCWFSGQHVTSSAASCLPR